MTIGESADAVSLALQFPLVLLLVEPPPEATGEARVYASGDADTELAFTRGAEGVELWVQGFTRTGSSETEVVCQFPSLAGRAKIPRAIAAELPTDSEIDVYTAAATQTTVRGLSTRVDLVGQVFTGEPKRLVRLWRR